MPSFARRLRSTQQSKGTALCVGLDPDPSRLPQHVLHTRTLAEAALAFNLSIIEATHPFACAFKLNFAFFEALGTDGHRVLEATLAQIPADVLTIADAKRGDIGNSARFYARSIFEGLGFDAATVAPYMGRDAVAPFLAYEGRAAFVLGRTSNAGAADFQEQMLGDRPLYRHVAERVAAWDAEAPGTAGLVVGATSPEVLGELRSACPSLPFLIPGVGAQGGDPAAVMEAAATSEGLVLVNSSRGILYASEGPDYAEAAAREAERLRDALRGA